MTFLHGLSKKVCLVLEWSKSGYLHGSLWNGHVEVLQYCISLSIGFDCIANGYGRNNTSGIRVLVRVLTHIPPILSSL
jgi:hypothetical protein